MDELQPDITFDESVVEEQPDNQAESEGQVTDPASATGDTDNDQAVEFTPAQQEKFNREIGKKVAKLREIERENQRLQRERDELQQKLPKEQRPIVPAMPDPYALTDEQYRQQAQQREELLRQQAAYDARQQFVMQQQEQQRLAEQQRIENERLEVLNRNADLYRQRALKYGTNEKDLIAAGQTVYQALGNNNPLADIILSNEDGPLITLFLGNNPLELDSLLREPNPLQAAVKLVTDIRQKAATLKRKVSTTPDPINAPRSSGVGARTYGADGATYE